MTDYEEVSLVKQGEKSTVHLVREKGKDQLYIRKVLHGQHPVYQALINCSHPCLPKLYDVVFSENTTTVIEEYIEGKTAGNVSLSDKRLRSVAGELCSVLEYLHGQGIIHRDIKPSNIIIAGDGHIRLIDFDAARMPKEDAEQDTKLLGTRGYAPPEQYGFMQTDERADIYALGVTLRQLSEGVRLKPRYGKVLRKCTALDPDRRYQSVREVRRALFHAQWAYLYAAAAVLLIVLSGAAVSGSLAGGSKENVGSAPPESAELTVLPAPENPHWDGETGTGLWGHVFESGIMEDEETYYYRVYWSDTETPPDLDSDAWEYADEMGGNIYHEEPYFPMNLAACLEKNGFYWFAVSAIGDGIHYADSPYVLSDAFEYTGESAPMLPVPTGLAWRTEMPEEGSTRWHYYATWDNLDDYAETDSFNVSLYDGAGNLIFNNIWTKEKIRREGYIGIRILPEFMNKADEKYRFTVQALTSRPNEYRSSPMPDPVPEEYFSPVYSSR